MRASEVRAGDHFIHDGRIIYTVDRVTTATTSSTDGEGGSTVRNWVRAHITYTADGGTDIRSWDVADDIPLIHPLPTGWVR